MSCDLKDTPQWKQFMRAMNDPGPAFVDENHITNGPAHSNFIRPKVSVVPQDKLYNYGHGVPILSVEGSDVVLRRGGNCGKEMDRITDTLKSDLVDVYSIDPDSIGKGSNIEEGAHRKPIYAPENMDKNLKSYSHIQMSKWDAPKLVEPD